MATDILSAFKSLPLEQQSSVYQQITAAFSAAKEARRSQLETEIKSLGFIPGEVKRTAKVKYRSPSGETWSGVGAMANWLKKLKDGGEDIEKYRV